MPLLTLGIFMSNAAQIKELEEKIAALKEADARFAALQPEYQLAIKLHDLLCHHNHADGCGWHYEGSNGVTDWTGHAHSRYLEKAYKVQKFCECHDIPTSKALDFITLINKG